MSTEPAETPPSDSRTLIASVLFLDIAGYSRFGVTEQIRLKQNFNEVLSAALQDTEARERVLIDTGDGAAVAFLGNPERALFAALAVFDNVGKLPVRMGINMGPVHVSRDINGQENVIGDGINVAQRIMSFAAAGQLFVSRTFYDVVQLLSGEYATMFQPVGGRTDKHARTHEVFAVNPAVRVARSVAVTQRMRALRRPAAAPSAPGRATISDAGTHFIISGPSRESVESELARLGAEGVKVLAAPALVGAKWMATCENRRATMRVNVDKLGMKSIITGASREAVEVKLKELLGFGARLDGDIELVDGLWTAVCDDPS
ncbi:MAG TPA: adenylate/guanylate cyclase domain-containing protein [Burkholderiales bacterium]|nr:adenylate/guanylate cyclase domain-containing protein [Burkholderiales bacterium]